MTDTKSYAEFVLGLYASLLKDCEVQYPALAKEFRRDLSRLGSAIESHGIRFVLDTMPAYRKHFDQCLSKQRLTHSQLIHFGSWKNGGTVPRLFRGLFLRVFDLTGEMKPEPDLHALRHLRQLLGAFRRFRLPCSPRAASDAVREFLRTDLEVRSGDLDWSSDSDFESQDTSEVSFVDISPSIEDSNQGVLPGFEVSQLNYRHGECIQQVADYISSCLGPFDPYAVRFRHGPGAVADQVFGTHKYEFRNWPDRLDRVFPMADFACANYANWFDSILYKTSDQETKKEFPAKLIAVPKTIKTPRLIASEPISLQWCQQSVRDFLYVGVRESPICHFVEFNRQDANGDLALHASHSGQHCTIDLSSASDRVSCWHVERLFRRSPSLLNALRATRSLYIKQDICKKLPELYKLRKFSTMGNATTFPIQSLFFLAVCLGTVLYVRNQRLSARWIRSLGDRQVRVFGDDLIVPDDCAAATVDALIALGLKVNNDKTFLTGKFRESCGVDAFDGRNVTTASILSAPEKAKPGSIVSSVDVHNNLCRLGYFYASAYIQKTVERTGYTRIRTVTDGSGSFGWYENFVSCAKQLKSRFNKNLQVLEVQCLGLKTKSYTRPSMGSAAVLQYFTEVQKEVKNDKSSLYYHQQRPRVKLGLRWTNACL